MDNRTKVIFLSILLLTVSIMLSGCTDTASVKNKTDKVNNNEVKNNINDKHSKVNNSDQFLNSTNVTSSSSKSTSSYSSDDLFPNKIEVKYAKGFNVEYHDTYKILTVNDVKEGKSFKYALVQNGTIPPSVNDDIKIIEIPVKSIVTVSLTQIQALEIIEELDKLVGVSSNKYIYSPSLKQFIQDKNIPEITSGDGMSFTFNTETLVKISPSIVMIAASGGSGGSDKAMDNLNIVGINYVVNADWLEETPLGRTEWIKFESLFFNKEKEANDYFVQTENNYNNIKTLTANITDKPTVMSGNIYQGTWYVSGGKSYVATFIKDAGGNYLWSNDTSTANLNLDYESVFNKAKDAQYWFTTTGRWNTIDDMKKEDPLYMSFNSAQNGNVFTFDARINKEGSNDYWESGIMKPDVILKDYVKALHTELVPNHNLVYCKQVKSDNTALSN